MKVTHGFMVFSLTNVMLAVTSCPLNLLGLPMQRGEKKQDEKANEDEADIALSLGVGVSD